ncbi:hypothetical protein CRG98_007708 [Punica granatum]|uniref:Uncharacterized protein n=1 Tax=Punica granatum TaxID=22663 RepID=A0A2I0KU92_PUNGR|nr:hypothetical protein CRG98_007708 [Punica granatum]
MAWHAHSDHGKVQDPNVPRPEQTRKCEIKFGKSRVNPVKEGRVERRLCTVDRPSDRDHLFTGKGEGCEEPLERDGTTRRSRGKKWNVVYSVCAAREGKAKESDGCDGCVRRSERSEGNLNCVVGRLWSRWPWREEPRLGLSRRSQGFELRLGVEPWLNGSAWLSCGLRSIERKAGKCLELD